MSGGREGYILDYSQITSTGEKKKGRLGKKMQIFPGKSNQKGVIHSRNLYTARNSFLY